MAEWLNDWMLHWPDWMRDETSQSESQSQCILYYGSPQINWQFINKPRGGECSLSRHCDFPALSHPVALLPSLLLCFSSSLFRCLFSCSTRVPLNRQTNELKTDRPTCRVHLLFMSSYQHQTMSDHAFCVDNNNNNESSSKWASPSASRVASSPATTQLDCPMWNLTFPLAKCKRKCRKKWTSSLPERMGCQGEKRGRTERGRQVWCCNCQLLLLWMMMENLAAASQLNWAAKNLKWNGLHAAGAAEKEEHEEGGGARGLNKRVSSVAS